MDMTTVLEKICSGEITMKDVLYASNSANAKRFYENHGYYAALLRERYSFEVDYHLEKAIRYLFGEAKPQDPNELEAYWSTINVFLNIQGAPLTADQITRWNELGRGLKMPHWKTDSRYCRNSRMERSAPQSFSAGTSSQNGKANTPDPFEVKNKKNEPLYLVFHTATYFPLTVLSKAELQAIQLRMGSRLITRDLGDFTGIPETLADMIPLILSQIKIARESNGEATYITNEDFYSILQLPSSEKSQIPLEHALLDRIPLGKGFEYYLLAKSKKSELMHDFMANFCVAK